MIFKKEDIDKVISYEKNQLENDIFGSYISCALEIKELFIDMNLLREFELAMIVDRPVVMLHNSTINEDEMINIQSYRLEKLSNLIKEIPSTTKSVLIWSISKHTYPGNPYLVRLYFTDDILEKI